MAMGLVGRSVPPSERVTALSRAAAISYASFVFGPPLMGLVAQTVSLAASFAMVGGILVAVAVFLVPLLARRLRMAGHA